MKRTNTHVIVDSYQLVNEDEQPEIVRESEKAVCFKQGGVNFWIPRKCIVSQGHCQYGWFLEIPIWLAKEKGMLLGVPSVPMVY